MAAASWSSSLASMMLTSWKTKFVFEVVLVAHDTAANLLYWSNKLYVMSIQWRFS